jgi:hypothetical protein
MTEKLNTQSVIARVKSETPRFWKKIRTLMIACGGLGITLTALKQEYIMEWLPAETCHYLIVAGAIGTMLASLTVKDPNP